MEENKERAGMRSFYYLTGILHGSGGTASVTCVASHCQLAVWAVQHLSSDLERMDHAWASLLGSTRFTTTAKCASARVPLKLQQQAEIQHLDSTRTPMS